MASHLPETPAAPQPPGRRLPAAQLALEAYWLVTRHPLAYGGQILVLSALAMIIQSVMTILVDGFTAGAVSLCGNWVRMLLRSWSAQSRRGRHRAAPDPPSTAAD